jgi:hypothetical protein
VLAKERKIREGKKREGGREGELVRCGFCLGREGENGGGEGYKGRNQKRAQHAFISSKVKTTCFSFF